MGGSYIYITIGIILLTVGIIIFLSLKNRDIKSTSLQINNNVPKISSEHLSTEEKLSLEKYFETLEKYLVASFLRKYLISFMSIKLSDEEDLKNKFIEIDIDKITFPLESSIVINKIDQLEIYLKSKLDKNEKVEPDYDKLLNSVKTTICENAHKKILNEMKPFIIDKSELLKWEDLYKSKPVSFIV